MSYQNSIPFETFKNEVQAKAQNKRDTRTVEDILRKVKSIIG